MNPGAGYRCTPPLLPSSALEGLEQFVPPDRPTHTSLAPSWKFKPLPDLPKRTSTSCNTQDGGKILISHHGAPVGVPCKGGNDSNLKLKQIVDLRHYLDEHFHHQTASRSCESLPEHSDSVTSTSTSQTSPKATTPTVDVTRLPSTSMWTTLETEGESLVRQNPRELQVRRPSLPTTVNSMHPSLMPAPLAIDGLRICTDVPPLPTPESIDFCHCHLPHPEHYSTGAGLESPHSYHRESHGWRPASSEYSSYDDTDPGRESSELLARESLDSQYPNRTRLYSFSAISRRQAYSDTDSDDGDIQAFTQNEELSRLTNAAVPPTPPDSSHGNDRTVTYSPFPSTRQYIERPKQLAIPPTDYQKYGAKIFADERKKQNRTTLLPKCMRKFLPWWSWREVAELEKNPKPESTTTTTTTKSKTKTVHKRGASDNRLKRGSGNGKTIKVEDIEKLSPFPSPYPLPPGSPRPAPHPPGPTRPLSAKPPSLPSLVFPCDFAIEEFFSENGDADEGRDSNEYGDGDGDDRPRTSSGQRSGWSFMTWCPAREGQCESTDDGRDSVDSQERLIQRSQSAMALRGYGLGIVRNGGFPSWL